MITEEHQRLDGAQVLVIPRTDENPPVGQRGIIYVGEDGTVRIRLSFPAMCYGQVRRKEITLTPADVERLLATERDGNFTFEIPRAVETPPTER